MRSLLSAMHKLSSLYPTIQFNNVRTCAAYVSMRPPISVKTMIDKINIMTVAFVLSGGGAKGDFQVGALQYIYRRGIRPNIICGTSVGAINGATIAEGEGGLEKLTTVWLSLINKNNMYEEEPPIKAIENPKLKEFFQWVGARASDGLGGMALRWALFPPLFFIDAATYGLGCAELLEAINTIKNGKSIYNLKPITEKLERLLDVGNVQRSGIHLRLAVVSLESGALQYVTESGYLLDPSRIDGAGQSVKLIDAVLASAAMPAIFPAVKLGNENYVDGGVREILPVQAAIDLNAGQIFAIACSKAGAGSKPSFDSSNLLDIALRAAEDIMPDETMRNETNPPRGWGVDVKLIQPSFIEGLPDGEVHNTLTIDPGLIRISMAYGYMRAYDVIMGSGDFRRFENLKNTSNEITRRRWDIWKLEGVWNEILASSGEFGPAPDALPNWLRTVRQKKRELKEFVEQQRLSESRDAIPDDIEAWWKQWEQHTWQPAFVTELNLPTPWDRLALTGSDLVEAETPP